MADNLDQTIKNHESIKDMAEFAAMQQHACAEVYDKQGVSAASLQLMQSALDDAALGHFTTSPNPAVGCVIVRDDQVLGLGHHEKAGCPHAEVMALKDANYEVEGATCYVTLEPCSHYGRTPPCAKALCEAKVKKVVIATADPNPLVAGRGVKMLRDAGIEVQVGLFHDEAFELNRAFFKSISTNQPFVVLKYGMSLDAKTALSNGESKWITNETCRSDVQTLRLWADAMLTSATTVRADNPQMNVRYEQLPDKVKANILPEQIRQPIKLVIDSHQTLSASEIESLSIFKSGLTYIVHGTHDPITVEKQDPNLGTVYAPSLFKIEKELAQGVFSVAVPFLRQADGSFHVDLRAVLKFADSLQVRMLMVESGPTLGHAFVENDLVDELVCYVAPKILGENAQSAFKLHEPAVLKDAKQFVCVEAKVIAGDVKLRMQHERILQLKERLNEQNRSLNNIESA